MGVIFDIGSAIGGLAQGIFGYKSQKSANKANVESVALTNQANREIADKTNAMNLQINRENQLYQRLLQDRQNDWNSPENQRRLLEAAGFTKQALLGSQGYNSMSTIGALGAPPTHGAVTGAPQQAAHVLPEDAFATSIGGIVRGLAENQLMLSQAKKADAESRGQELQNDVFMENFAANMKLLGLENEAKEIENRYKESKEVFSLNNLIANGDLLEQQISDLKLTQAIRTYYKDNIQPEELNEILSRIKNLDEKTRTEITQQDLNNKLGIAAEKNANANQLIAAVQNYKAPSEIALNRATAYQHWQQGDLFDRQVYAQEISNYVAENYGITEAQQRLVLNRFQIVANSLGISKARLERKLLSGQISEKEVDIMSKKLQLAPSVVKKYTDAIKGVGDMLSSFTPTM